MSLDVSLMAKKVVKKTGTGVFVRDKGKTRELSADEVKTRWPDSNVDAQEYETNCVFDANITHNLTGMANKAGLYEVLWRPDECELKYAKDLIPKMEKGLAKLKAESEYFKQMNPDNGWGSYEGLVQFVTDYLEACKEYPYAKIEVRR